MMTEVDGILTFITDNPLDCSCQLGDFQSWLKTSTKLDQMSRNEATCETPTNLANANLFNISDIVCSDDDDDDGDDDIVDFSMLDIPPAVALQKQIRESENLSLVWEIRLNAFKCQNLQIYSEDAAGNQTEVYSRPFECEKRHDNPHGVDYVTTSLEMTKIVSRDANNASLLACLVLINDEVDSMRPPVVSGCGSIAKVIEAEAGRHADGSTSRSTSSNLTLLHAFFNWNRDAISVFFRINSDADADDDVDACKIFLQVKDTDSFEDVIDQQTVPCKAQKFHFQSISLQKQKFYEICATLIDDSVTVTSQNVQCINVESETDSSTNFLTPTTSSTSTSASAKKAPILPLILTLIFLSIGIAVLVVLYLVVKGYMNERHRSGFLPEPAVAQTRRAYKVIDSLFSSLCVTCDVFSWKHRRRRRRDHIPVDQVDEFSLQDNLTVTSFMSD